MKIEIIIKSFNKLKDYCETNDFKGWDPYDGLNSPIINFKIFSESKLLRLIFIQTIKRLPINLRPILCIKKDYNPKGIALFLSGYCNLYKITLEKKYLYKINYLSNILMNLKNCDFSGSCWGYNFPWQTKDCLFPVNYPTVVTTSFAANSLMDAYDCTKNEKYFRTALSSCNFILSDLKRTTLGPGFIFSYTPKKKDCVYNASLLGSRLLARSYHYTKYRDYFKYARDSVIPVIIDQNKDGSWFYGKKFSQRWIDSFHTGFNLECLSDYQLYTADKNYSDNINRGLLFYLEHFFLKNGIAKYYSNRIFPIDIHSISVLIIALYRLGRLREYTKIVSKVLLYAINNFQSPTKGYFYYQKNKFYLNKIPYMRWSQAWIFYALSCFLSHFLET